MTARRRMGSRAAVIRIAAAGAACVLAALLGVAATWPIYETGRLWLVAGIAVVLGVGLGVARRLWTLRMPVFVAALLVAFALTVAPVAVPQAFVQGPLGYVRGLADGLAAVALGWKQLLTLDLPVGSYQTVLVPFYLVMLLSSLLATMIALRPGRLAALAAVPLLAPVAFGTIFGASVVSDPLRFGPLVVVAPRELGLWLAVSVLGAVWVAWTAGAERRAALRRGGADLARGRVVRIVAGAATVVVALVAGTGLAPAFDRGDRDVPRDRIDPRIIVEQQASPLSSYRLSKTDDEIDRELLTVSTSARPPAYLRFAVLDAYEGVDFHVSQDEAGRFTRFPSGDRLQSPAEVTVEIGEGYSEIWAPEAGLGDPPTFTGPRAAELSDAFYVNRDTGAAIAVPDGRGLTSGDGYSARMEAADSPTVAQRPAQDGPLIDLEQTPELAAWLTAQDLTPTGDGLTELIDRLRQRGYLSHAISEEDSVWLERLSEQYGTRFESSAGGHSLARIERLFSQLNTQQRAAGENPKDEMLVAGVGDDEQFATAGALIARALGYESRVVVGVRLADSAQGADDASEVPGIPACSGSCTGENLAAWIEVRGESGGWAPIDVTPQAEIRPQTLEEGEQLPEFPTVPEERDALEVDPPLGLGEQNDASDDTDDERGAGAWWQVLRAIGLSVATLLLLLLPLLFLPIAKRFRAKRRRAETVPELRALGAWNEMVDRARDAGVRLPDRGSRRDLGQVLGTRPAIWAAAEADRAVFAPESISDADADMLWKAMEADDAERRNEMTKRQRLGQAYAVTSYGLRFARPRRTARRARPEQAEHESLNR
ncbi:DUF3488 and transglutaminase-like domain-containing protein [Leucobacter sp. GX24907]